MEQSPQISRRDPRGRIAILAGFFAVIGVIFLWRLFYLQVIKHDHYLSAALSKQLKEYQIEPRRGSIQAYNGDKVVSIVLNEERFTLFADPTFITDTDGVAKQLAGVTGQSADELRSLLETKDTKYVVLAKKLPKDQAERITDLELKGVGTRSTQVRTYPESDVAAQVLGFVNEEGLGQYGIEGFMDETLTGRPGLLRAITDAEGVPLVSNSDNIVERPKDGQSVRLTLDVPMQRSIEQILKTGLDAAKAASGSLIVMESKTGAVKAMANYPSYSPGNYTQTTDIGVFNNPSVTNAFELGSVVKPLTVATALNTDTVGSEASYYDPNTDTVDGKVVSNAVNYGAAQRSIQEILEKSLNTGVVYLLKTLGGGEINSRSRNTLHQYLVDHYRYGITTGIEQTGESEGVVPDPEEGFGMGIRYANMSFGQGMTATPIQHVAAFNAVINGGTYYRPRLVDALVDADGKEAQVGPDVKSSDVVRDDVSSAIRRMLESTIRVNNFVPYIEGYHIGGKTGTAQIASPDGAYYEDRFNGTYVGYVGGAEPQYTVMVAVYEPKIPGFAGSAAAAPIFSNTVQTLIQTYNVMPE